MRILPVIVSAFLAANAAAAAPAPKPHPQASRAKPAVAPLDALFAQLARAQSPAEAQPIENQIFRLFEASGSPTVDLLMARATAATTDGDTGVAKRLFVSVTDIAPGYAEGWHARAQLEQESGDDEAAILALEKTIKLNPRQFAAYAELGDMLEEYGNKAGALKMYRRAIKLDPQLEGAARKVRQLERDVEGQGI